MALKKVLRLYLKEKTKQKKRYNYCKKLKKLKLGFWNIPFTFIQQSELFSEC